MKRILQYSTNLHVVVLFVFLLASSGFTTILHECRVQQQMACCAVPDRMNEDECDQNMAPKAGPSFESDQACHTNYLIGGVLPNPALLEKDVKTQIKRIVDFPLAIHVYNNPFDRISGPSSVFSPTVPAFPSSVEKYVLNVSFLI